MKFTKTNVLTLRPEPGKSDITIWDDAMPGFGIRFRNGGTGAYVVQYSLDGRQAKIGLGKVGKVTFEAAQNEARQYFAAIARKEDPAVARAKRSAGNKVTFESLIDDFIAWLTRRGRSEAYLKWTANCLKTYVPALNRRGIADIRRDDIANALRVVIKERGPVSSRNTRAALSKFFSWAIGEGKAEINPVDGTNKEQAQIRDRVPTPEEIIAIWRACGDDDFGDCIKLLILTGARRNQIGQLRRSEIKEQYTDKEGRVWPWPHLDLPGSRNKNKQRFLLPLSKQALAILAKRKARKDSEHIFGEGEGGFSGWSKAKRALDEKLGDKVEEWVLHDFRRSFNTYVQRCGVAPYIADLCLSHKGEVRSGVKEHYNHATYFDEKRAAMDAWGEFIAGLLRPKLEVVETAAEMA
jgi:integrase